MPDLGIQETQGEYTAKEDAQDFEMGFLLWEMVYLHVGDGISAWGLSSVAIVS
jgi:hypothetical protein